VNPYKTERENDLEAAIVGSLQVHLANGGHSFVHIGPYANQQGANLRSYCADLLGIIDQSSILLLEVKVLNCDTELLEEFDSEQFRDNRRFENLGVPIAYAYNATASLPYHHQRNYANWPQLTLMQINRSVPSALPGARPEMADHTSLFDWIEEARSGRADQDSVEKLGRAIGAAIQPAHLRNGVLALLYGIESQTLHALDEKMLQRVYNTLKNESALRPAQEAKLRRILGAATEVLTNAFPPPPTRRRGPGPGRPGSGFPIP